MKEDLDLGSYFLKENNKSLKEYQGFCVSLVNEALIWLGKKNYKLKKIKIESTNGILYPKKIKEAWRYHDVLYDGQYVHDPWHGRKEKLASYLNKMFNNREVTVAYKPGKWEVFKLGE